MSQARIYTADEAARFINDSLKLAGSPIRVSAAIEGDDLVVRAHSPNQEYAMAFPRTPSGHWFPNSIVNQAGPYFSAIQ
jgi:hypothetical protein